MVQVIQIKRKFTGAGVPASLAPGELAYNSTGDKLYVGGDLATVRGLVGDERQLEVHATSPVQTVAGGAKTFPLALLKVPGGNPGEALTMSAVDGTLTYAPIANPIQRFVGSFKGSDGSVLLTADAGGGTALPPVATSDGAYLICDAAGAVPPTGAPPGQYEIGDWLISNGVAWTHLFFGGISTVTATDVGVAPTVMGGDDVQEVLEAMEDAFVVGPAASAIGNIATYSTLLGHNIIDGGVALADLATIAYVDTENGAQDTLITANAAAIAALELNDAAQDTALDNKITKPATVAAIGNIATYADVGGAAALDGGRTIAQLDTAIAARGDVFSTAPTAADNIAAFSNITGKLIKDGGIATNNIALKTDLTTEQSLDVKIAGSTMTGALLLSEHPVSGTSPVLQAATLGYVDTAISSIPAAPPLVTAPELTGDGQTVATAITFTGITTDPTIGTGAAAAPFSGKGLSTDPLMLVCVDGGEYL